MNEVRGIRALASALALAVVAGAALGDANVRAVHASPDAPAVDVRVNGAVAFPNLAFRSATAYAALPAATYNLGLSVAGTDPVVYNEDVAVSDGLTYTVAAVGRLGVAGEFDLLPFLDDNTLDAAAARIRFIHASPDAPAVDITLTDGTVLFGNVAFRNSGGYISVPGGVYDLQVRLAGTSDVVLSVPGLAVSNNTVSTVFAMGLVGGSGDQALQAVPVVDAVPTPGTAAMLALAGVFAARRRR